MREIKSTYLRDNLFIHSKITHLDNNHLRAVPLKKYGEGVELIKFLEGGPPRILNYSRQWVSISVNCTTGGGGANF